MHRFYRCYKEKTRIYRYDLLWHLVDPKGLLIRRPFRMANKISVVMRQEHKSGERAFVDYDDRTLARIVSGTTNPISRKWTRGSR